jgi:hypothetical protein
MHTIRDILEILSPGKRLEQLAVERRPQKSEAERIAYALKRREAADKRRQYGNEESVKDIRWFEKFKAIRVFDYAGAFGYDLDGAMVEKLAYNRNWADHKPEARIAEHGKKF